jgi:4'-phosphopantetheinyl transferase
MIHWRLRGDARRDREHDADLSLLTLAERARHVGLRMPRRRAEWLLGRLAAKSVVAEALAQPGASWPLRSIEIASAPSGAPRAQLAPEAEPFGGFSPGERLPVSVSISHAEGLALCAAARAGPAGDRSGRTIGIDLGRVESRSPAFVDTFFTADEQRLVRDASPSDRELRANLIWCAKEAVLKALGLGLTVDTRGVSCLPEAGPADLGEWPLAPADSAWHPFVAACGPALHPGGGTIRGIWRSFPGFVGALAATIAPTRDAALASCVATAEAARSPRHPAGAPGAS